MAKNQNKSSKVGRQRKRGQNLRYINENRHTKGHIRRLKVHTSRFPTDVRAADTLSYYKGKLGTRFG